MTNERYLRWLIKEVTSFSRPTTNKLYSVLFARQFTWTINRDANRAVDGIDLRYKYLDSYGRQMLEVEELIQPCSVLEMMVALAKRCDFQTSANYDDDKAWLWFDEMLKNLGLFNMTDEVFNEEIVDDILTRFLDRRYKSNGEGGLFYIPGYDKDMRKIEIWYQMCAFVNSTLDLSI